MCSGCAVLACLCDSRLFKRVTAAPMTGLSSTEGKLEWKDEHSKGEGKDYENEVLVREPNGVHKVARTRLIKRMRCGTGCRGSHSLPFDKKKKKTLTSCEQWQAHKLTHAHKRHRRARGAGAAIVLAVVYEWKGQRGGEVVAAHEKDNEMRVESARA